MIQLSPAWMCIVASPVLCQGQPDSGKNCTSPGKLDLLFCISHLLDLHVKSECVITWKAIMTVEVAGLRVCGR